MNTWLHIVKLLFTKNTIGSVSTLQSIRKCSGYIGKDRSLRNISEPTSECGVNHTLVNLVNRRILIRRNRYLFFQGNIQKRLKKCDYYFFETREHIRQVSALAGNNILKSLNPEYAIIKTNAVRKKNMSGISVQLLQ